MNSLSVKLFFALFGVMEKHCETSMDGSTSSSINYSLHMITCDYIIHIFIS